MPRLHISPRYWMALVVMIVLGAGCGTTRPPAPAVPQNAPVTEYQMEPIKITAVKGPDGVHIESIDAAELFEQGGAALSEKRLDAAIAAYDRLLKEFNDSRRNPMTVRGRLPALGGCFHHLL